jgi:hypothetical protein
MPQLTDKLLALEQYDYQRYLGQIAEFSMEEKEAIFADWRLYRRAFCWVVENLPDGTTRSVRFEPRGWPKAQPHGPGVGHQQY